MCRQPSSARPERLERSCAAPRAAWIRQEPLAAGVERFAAWFPGPAYRAHRHDTYAIGLTLAGVQAFAYRGAGRISTPGEFFVLHPDEIHDGNPGTEAGFGYRQLYVAPALIFDAVRQIHGQAAALPFVRQPVVRNPTLAAALRLAFTERPEPLALDEIIGLLAEGLAAADPSCGRRPAPRRLDVAAVARARDFLDAEKTRVVRSWELEQVTGLTRYDLARQFRRIYGTSPYRYLLMRRLDLARAEIARGRPPVDVAQETGFADQAHLTRAFAAAVGIAPARYRALSAPAR